MKMFELTSALRTNRQKMYSAPEGHSVSDVNEVGCSLLHNISFRLGRGENMEKKK